MRRKSTEHVWVSGQGSWVAVDRGTPPGRRAGVAPAERQQLHCPCPSVWGWISAEQVSQSLRGVIAALAGVLPARRREGQPESCAMRASRWVGRALSQVTGELR